MKYIIYILIVVFISNILISAIPKSIQNSNNELTLQCITQNADIIELKQSANIIENRLKTFGIDNFEVETSKTKSSIHISFENSNELKKSRELVTSTGQIKFYETFDRNEILELLSNEDELFSLLKIPFKDENTVMNSAILGYCNVSNVGKVNMQLINSYASSPNNGVKYTWSKYVNIDNMHALYLLKNTSTVEGLHILKSTVHNANFNELSITFNKKGSELWQKLSEESLGKPVAFVIDNKVYCAPQIMSVIKNGKCQLSGNFSIDETKLMSALINNGELPLKFKIIE